MVKAGSNSDPGGFAPADPLRRRSRGPQRPAPLRRARPWRAYCAQPTDYRNNNGATSFR